MQIRLHFIHFKVTITLILFIRSEIELEAIETIAPDNRTRTINWRGPLSLTHKRKKKQQKQQQLFLFVFFFVIGKKYIHNRNHDHNHWVAREVGCTDMSTLPLPGAGGYWPGRLVPDYGTALRDTAGNTPAKYFDDE